MIKKYLAFLIILIFYISPVYAESPEIKLEKATEAYIKNTEINIIKKNRFSSVTFSEIINEHNEKKESDFWAEVKISSLITTKVLSAEKTKTLFDSYFEPPDLPVFKRSYSLKKPEKPENRYGKPDLKCSGSQWEFAGMKDRPGLKIFNLRASKKKPSFDKEKIMNKTWEFIKGERGDDSILLGMFSHHTSDNSHNETHNLLGIDYKGYSIGTFKNSYSDQSVYGCIHRKIYEYKLAKNIKFDIKYKFGAIYGYDDHYPNIAGITPIIMPMFGLTLWNVGMDFIAIPDDNPTFSFNFRLNLPNKNKTVLKKAEVKGKQ